MSKPEQKDHHIATEINPFLPNDVARCNGAWEDGAWRDGCEHCVRRLSRPNVRRLAYMAPPPSIKERCAYLIELPKSS